MGRTEDVAAAMTVLMVWAALWLVMSTETGEGDGVEVLEENFKKLGDVELDKVVEIIAIVVD